jgi:hypothetical protein
LSRENPVLTGWRATLFCPRFQPANICIKPGSGHVPAKALQSEERAIMRKFTCGLAVLLSLPAAALAQLGPPVTPIGAAAAVLAANNAAKNQQPKLPGNVIAPVNIPPTPQKKFTLASLWPFGKKNKTPTLQYPTSTPKKTANPFADMAPMPTSH